MLYMPHTYYNRTRATRNVRRFPAADSVLQKPINRDALTTWRVGMCSGQAGRGGKASGRETCAPCFVTPITGYERYAAPPGDHRGSITYYREEGGGFFAILYRLECYIATQENKYQISQS